MQAYARRALQPRRTTEEKKSDLRTVIDRRDATASGIYQYISDFQLGGDPIGEQLKRRGEINLDLLENSIPEAETFVQTARKSMNYTIGEAGFTESVEKNEAVLERVRNRIHRYVASSLNRLVFEGVPENVMEATRRRVDEALVTTCPAAIEKFRVAYEELSGSSAENWTNACTAARRILVDFADSVYPPREEIVDGRKVGKEEYVNRLWAYAKQKLTSERSRGMAIAELEDLGKRIDAINALSNKGVHSTVSKDEADRIIIRTYLLIADLL